MSKCTSSTKVRIWERKLFLFKRLLSWVQVLKYLSNLQLYNRSGILIWVFKRKNHISFFSSVFKVFTNLFGLYLLRFLVGGSLIWQFVCKMHTQRPKNQAHSHSLPPPTVRWLSLCGVIRRLLMNFICLSACRQNSVFFLSLLVWLVCLPLCPLLLSIRMRNLRIHILSPELH